MDLDKAAALYIVTRRTREYRKRPTKTQWAVLSTSIDDAIAFVKLNGGAQALVLLPDERELEWSAVVEAEGLVQI
jgi:hypothetical protein